MSKRTLLFSMMSMLILFSYTSVEAQSHYQQVHSIIQNKCMPCHNSSNAAGSLVLDLDEGDLYDLLVEGDVSNPFANQQGLKMIDRGYPDRSYLFHKINSGLYEESMLDSQAGETMPPYGAPNGPLTTAETEFIRQWITYGANEDDGAGSGSSLSTIEDYYDIAAAGTPNVDYLPKMEKPAAPAPDEGFQLRMGTLFLEPEEEDEYLYKYDLELEADTEIHAIEVFMNEESHHFLLFSYPNQSEADGDPEGFQVVTNQGLPTFQAFQPVGNYPMVGGWESSRIFDLPEGTAYFWPEDAILQFNYHIDNYHANYILPADIYINVYTQPVGTAVKEMRSNFILNEDFTTPIFIGGQAIPPGEPTTLEDVINNDFMGAGGNDTIHLWAIGPHTHKYGTDYDIFLRNNDGSKGEQIFEGTSSYLYDANGVETEIQGVGYDYAEPFYRYFNNSFLAFKHSDGLIHEASYLNTSNSNVGFGLSTNDEMMGVFVQYLVGDISELPTTEPVDVERTNPQAIWAVYPNPYAGATQIQYILPEQANVSLDVYNILGKKVATLVDGPQANGQYQYSFGAVQNGFPEGMYIVQLSIDGVTYTKTIMETK